MKAIAAAALAAPFAGPAAAAPLCDDLGLAGLLAACNKADLPALTLAGGKPLSEAPWQLQSGVGSEVEASADGSQELALAGAEFFRALWIDEVVIHDPEVRPPALDSLGVDDEGTIEFSFLAIRPGSHGFKIPGSTGETQRVQISIQ